MIRHGWIPTLFVQTFINVPEQLFRRRCLGVMSAHNFANRNKGIGVVMMAKKSEGNAYASSPFIEIGDMSESWKLSPAIDLLKEGGLGVIPTDTCYMFVTSVQSRPGVERIYSLKSNDAKLKKPLSLLCNSISQISHYTTAMNSKRLFKMLKELLPGPYTFIFPATNELPRMILEHKGHLKTWKRREIGVRMPDHDVCQAVIEELGSPLLCASIGLVDAAGNAITEPVRLHELLGRKVDFVVDAGIDAEPRVSTVVDLTDPENPVVLREGAGSVAEMQAFL